MARLDLNVASRPFVNDRPLRIGIGVVLFVLAVATFLNTYKLIESAVRWSVLSGELAARQGEIDAAQKATEAIDRHADRTERRLIRDVAQETSGIIRKRQLSWSMLFDEIESILPRDVRLLSILPDVRDERVLLLMDCHAKDHESKREFYRRLQQPPFSDAYLLGESMEGSRIRFNVRASYHPGEATAAAEAQQLAATGVGGTEAPP